MKQTVNILLVILLGVLFALESMFVITPHNKAMLSYLGDLKSDGSGTIVYDAGLYFKLPFFEKVIRIDQRLQSFDVPSTRVLTADLKDVHVDYYVKWRVKDYESFYKSLNNGNFDLASGIIKSKSIDALRAEFGVRVLSEIIAGDDRDAMLDSMMTRTANSVSDIGIEVVDVRLKRVDYPQEVTLSVYENMRSSRERDAKKYRATGVAAAQEISSKADRDVIVIIEGAKREAAEHVAQAHAIAADVYANSFKKAPDFYTFYLKMIGYKNSVNDKDFFVLDPNNSEYYRDLAT